VIAWDPENKENAMRWLITACCTVGVLALAGVAMPGEKKSEAKGTLTLGGKTYQLASALAYEQTVFKKKEIAIVLSEKPLDTAKLRQSLQKHGNDDDFFPTEAHVKLSCDGGGGLLQLSIHVGGANIIRSGDPNIKTKVTIQDGTVKGTAGMQKPDEFRNMPLQFDVAFEVPVLPATLASPGPKPPLEPKTRPKTKTTSGEPNKPAQVTEKELRFEGKLANNSSKVLGKPARIHQVRMSPDKTYLIDLESSDFDAYLRILDSAGKELATDDDSGEGLNARIRFTPPKEDNYQIVATRFSSGQGNYVLKIRDLTPGEPGKPALAAEKELRFEGKLANDSPKVMGKPAQVHQVSLSPDKTYVIDLESSEFDAYLRILDSNGKQLAKDDDSGGNHNARIRFTPPKEGNYQVVATRFGLDQGNYVLKIRVLRVGEEKQP
jgi:Bacterial pre-peptidase C-terminal domain